MRTKAIQLILLAGWLLAACAPPALPPGAITASLAPEAVTAVPERPTRPAPTTVSPAPVLEPLTTTLTLSLLTEWDAPPAHDLAWFPDGTRLAVSSARGVYVYDAATLQEQQFIDAGGPVSGFALSADGRTLATVNWQNGLQLWNVRTSQRRLHPALTRALAEMTGIGALAFSPDGRYLAVSAHGAVMVSDLASGKSLHRWQQETYIDATGGQTLTFSHNGRLLATDSPHGVWVMDVESGALVHTIENTSTPPPARLAFSLDDRVLVGASDGRIAFWEVATGTLRRERALPGFAGVALTRDGLRLAGVGEGFIALSDAVAGTPRLRLMGHTGYAARFAYNPGGARLAALDANSTLWVWQVDIGRVVATLDRHVPWVTEPALSPDGQTLAFGSGQRVWLWDLSAGTAPRPVFTQPEFVSRVAFSPNGRWLVSGGAAPVPRRIAQGPTATTRVWDLAAGRLRDNLPSQGYAITALAFSADGQTLATGGEDTVIRLWDIHTGQLRRELTGYQTSPIQLAFTPDAQQLLSLALPFEGCYEACHGGYLPAREEPQYLRLWDTSSGQVSTYFDVRGNSCGYETALLSPNGRQLLGNFCDGAGLWLQRDGGPRLRVRYPGALRGLVFSPDGRTLAGLAADEGTVVVLDPDTGAVIAAALPADGAPHWLTYLPNGRLLAWGVQDGVVRLWHGRLSRVRP